MGYEINDFGTKFWYKEGKLHREDGPAIEYSGGSKAWYVEGEPHREDGPAIEYINGYKAWLKKGKFHRIDGPAILFINDKKSYFEYYYLGKQIKCNSDEEYFKLLKLKAFW